MWLFFLALLFQRVALWREQGRGGDPRASGAQLGRAGAGQNPPTPPPAPAPCRTWVPASPYLAPAPRKRAVWGQAPPSPAALAPRRGGTGAPCPCPQHPQSPAHPPPGARPRGRSLIKPRSRAQPRVFLRAANTGPGAAPAASGQGAPSTPGCGTDGCRYRGDAALGLHGNFHPAPPPHPACGCPGNPRALPAPAALGCPGFGVGVLCPLPAASVPRRFGAGHVLRAEVPPWRRPCCQPRRPQSTPGTRGHFWGGTRGSPPLPTAAWRRRGRERSRWRHRNAASRHASAAPPCHCQLPGLLLAPQKSPGAPGAVGGSRRLRPGAWSSVSVLPGLPRGHQTLPTQPLPLLGDLSWWHLGHLRAGCSPRAVPRKALGHFGAAPALSASPRRGWQRPQAHALLCTGGPRPPRQCHPHHSWEPNPKPAPGGGPQPPPAP
nr:translation initiation factor IF-2-like isoform X1 [Anser cygnoides]